MGSETSKSTGNQLNFDIPSSLRSVNPFLQLAYRFLVNIQSEDEAETIKRISTNKLIVSCINKAFHLLAVTNIEIDTDGKICLENYRYARNCIIHELKLPLSLSYPEYVVDKLNDTTTLQIRQHFLSLTSPHAAEIILFEADLVLSLADELNQEDCHQRDARGDNDVLCISGGGGIEEGSSFRDYASDQYHTAAIYYRVMQSMIQSTYSSNSGNNDAFNYSNDPNSNNHNQLNMNALLSNLDAKILYTAAMSRKTSLLTPNIPSEHFNQHLCADVYEINGAARLGKGSYGSVYLATHRLTQDERAVKVMNVEKVTSYYLRKLHTEIAILRCIDHPNIINLQDVFFGKRSVYIVTHICRGGELFDLLNSGKSKGFVFKENRAALLIRDMLSAIHYLHTYCSIVHRDLKLENFLFERADIDSPLVLIDFGLAKKFEKGERMKQRVGSCYYTAPEVLYSDYDHTCDVWSIGVLSYMILSGSPPFAGQNPEEVYEAILSEEAQYPPRKFGHLSEHCIDFLKCLLVKNPTYRISSKNALNHPFITLNCQSHWQPLAQTQSITTEIAPLIPSMLNTAAVVAGGGGVLSNQQINQLLTSFTYFLSLDPLTQLILYLIAHSLPADLITDMRNEFYCIDMDHSGTISYAEFCNAFYVSDSIQSGAFQLSLAFTELCRKSNDYVSMNNVNNNSSNNTNNNNDNDNHDNGSMVNDRRRYNNNNNNKNTSHSINNTHNIYDDNNNNNSMNVDDTSHDYSSHYRGGENTSNQNNINNNNSNNNNNNSNNNASSSNQSGLLSNVKKFFTTSTTNNNSNSNSNTSNNNSSSSGFSTSAGHSSAAGAGAGAMDSDNNSMSTFSGTTHDTYNTSSTAFSSSTTANTPLKPSTGNNNSSNSSSSSNNNSNSDSNSNNNHSSSINSNLLDMELSYRVFIAACIPLRLALSTERLQLALSLLLDHDATTTAATTLTNTSYTTNPPLPYHHHLHQGFVVTSESLRTFVGEHSVDDCTAKSMISHIRRLYLLDNNNNKSHNRNNKSRSNRNNNDNINNNYSNNSNNTNRRLPDKFGNNYDSTASNTDSINYFNTPYQQQASASQSQDMMMMKMMMSVENDDNNQGGVDYTKNTHHDNDDDDDDDDDDRYTLTEDSLIRHFYQLGLCQQQQLQQQQLQNSHTINDTTNSNNIIMNTNTAPTNTTSHNHHHHHHSYNNSAPSFSQAPPPWPEVQPSSSSSAYLPLHQMPAQTYTPLLPPIANYYPSSSSSSQPLQSFNKVNPSVLAINLSGVNNNSNNTNTNNYHHHHNNATSNNNNNNNSKNHRSNMSQTGGCNINTDTDTSRTYATTISTNTATTIETTSTSSRTAASADSSSNNSSSSSNSSSNKAVTRNDTKTNSIISNHNNNNANNNSSSNDNNHHNSNNDRNSNNVDGSRTYRVQFDGGGRRNN